MTSIWGIKGSIRNKLEDDFDKKLQTVNFLIVFVGEISLKHDESTFGILCFIFSFTLSPTIMVECIEWMYLQHKFL